MQEFTRRGAADTNGKFSNNGAQRARRCLDRAGRLWGSSDSWLSVEPTKMAGTREAARRCLEQTARLWNPSRWIVVEPERVAALREVLQRCLGKVHQLLTGIRHLLSLERSTRVLFRVQQLLGACRLPAGQVRDVVLFIILLVGSVLATYGIAYLPDAGLVDRDWELWVLLVVCPPVTVASFFLVAPDVLASIQNNTTAVFLPAVNYSQAFSNVLGLAYGIHVSNVSVLVMNMIGFAAQILCLLVEHYVRAPSGRLFCFSIRFSLGWITILYVSATAMDITVIGPAMGVSNTVTCVLPLMYLGPTVRNRTFSKWGMFCVSAAFFINLAWAALGVMLQDMPLLIPSVIAAQVSAIRIAIGFWCWGWLSLDMTLLFRVYSPEHSAQGMASVEVPPGLYGKQIDLEDI